MVLNYTNVCFFGVARKRSGDIREILACGTLSHTDIEYGPVVGSGNCGTVHRCVENNYRIRTDFLSSGLVLM